MCGVVGEEVAARRLVEEMVGNHSRPRICKTGVAGGNGQTKSDMKREGTYIPDSAFAMTLQRTLPKKYWLSSEKMLVPSGVTKGRSSSQPLSSFPFPKTRSLIVGQSLKRSDPVIHEPPGHYGLAMDKDTRKGDIPERPVI